MKFITAILISIILALTLNNPSYAGIESLSQAINESGRLRMLSQRLAKTRLLTSMDIQPNRINQQQQESLSTFKNNLDELTRFSHTLTSGREAILTQIKDINAKWKTFNSELSANNQELNIDLLIEQSDQLLSSCEVLVSQLEQIANRRSARWVNLSGRQRMLSQRIAKLYSAITLSHAYQHSYHKYLDSLNTAIIEFEQALQELLASPDNSHFIQHKLGSVLTQWQFSKQGFKALDQGKSTPLVISITTESILRQMNDVTALYEEVDRNKHSR